MISPHLLPIAEAAAFTLGCAVIGSRRLDPRRLEIAQAILVIALLLLVMIVALPEGPQDMLADPNGVRNFLN